MRTSVGDQTIRALPEAHQARRLPRPALAAAGGVPVLLLALATALGLRGVAGLALVAGAGLGAALLFVLGPAPRWPAALLVGCSVVLAAIVLLRAASWIDAAL